MDVVTSFFALEHVEDPGLFVGDLTKYLKKDGSLYIIVPNLYENFADLFREFGRVCIFGWPSSDFTFH